MHCEVGCVHQQTEDVQDLAQQSCDGIAGKHLYTQTTMLQGLKKPPTSHFLLAAAGIADGAARPGDQVVGALSLKHIYEIAKVLMA
jgi:Ribosomal protein L11, RNA binding domain